MEINKIYQTRMNLQEGDNVDKFNNTSHILVAQLKDFQEIPLQKSIQTSQDANASGYSLTQEKGNQEQHHREPLFGTHVKEVIRAFKNW